MSDYSDNTSLQVSDGSVVLLNKKDKPIVEYDGYITETRILMETTYKKQVFDMVALCSYIYDRVESAVNTFGYSEHRVYQDIANDKNGLMKFNATSVRHHASVHVFLQTVKVKHPHLYKGILKNINTGKTKFIHLAYLSVGLANFDEKIEILEKHLSGDKLYLTGRDIRRHARKKDLKTPMSNQWKTPSMISNLLNAYIPNGQFLYAPFGTELIHDRIIYPHEKTTTDAFDGIFVDRDTRKQLEDESVDNLLLHFPAHNLRIRESLTMFKYIDNNAFHFYEEIFLEKFCGMIDESYRVLKLGGIFAVVSWNISWTNPTDGLKDFNFDSRRIAGNRFNWINSPVISLDQYHKTFHPEQSYRMMHIFRKI